MAARLASQLGKFQQAHKWLVKAFQNAEERGELQKLREKAMDEPDLKPLWEHIGKAGP